MCFLLSRPLNQGATTLRAQLVEGIFCTSFHPAKTPVLTFRQVPDKGHGLCTKTTQTCHGDVLPSPTQQVLRCTSMSLI